MTKNVELVVKARDAATGAIEQIKDALKDLTGVQDQVGKSAAKTDGLLSDLGAQLNKLNRQANSLSAMGKIANELERATGAVQRIEGGLATSARGFAELSKSAEQAKTVTAELRAQANLLTRDLKAQAEATKAAKAAQTQINAEVRKAERTLSTLQARAQKSASPSADLLKQVADQQQAVAALKVNQGRAVANFQAQRQTQDATTGSLRALNEQIRAAERNEKSLATSTQTAANAIRKQEGDLAKARSGLAEIEQVSQQASTALGGLAANQTAVAQASARMAAELARTKAQIAGLSAAPKTGAPVTGEVGDSNAIQRQRKIVLEARREWIGAQEDVKRLANELRNATAPTEAMGAALGRAQAAARQAKQEYAGQREALQALARTAQSSFAAFDQAAIRMQRGSTTARQVAQAYASIPPAAHSAASSIESASIMAQAHGATLQTVRQQIVGLVAAYAGLSTAVSQIAGVLSAVQTLEAAESRLGVVFQQNPGRVNRELAALQKDAQRLGISFGTLVEQYGKFAIAANIANFSADDTRKIFIAVAEAARVSKLSAEQVSGTFLALEQMISKGKVTAEELRGQLAERLPGAFALMAKAIGVTTAELDKMLQAGEVIADRETLLKFADELGKRFGPQLENSLKATGAEVGRWSDNVYQAQLQVARGGFAESFTRLLREMNGWFQSRAGRDFFLSIGSALGKVIDGAAVLARHFEEVRFAVSALISIRVGREIAGWTTELMRARTAAVAFAGSANGASTSLISLKTAGAGLSAAVGGLPGLIATGVTAAALNWATSVRGATLAIDEHKRQMGELIAAYASLRDKAADWAETVQGVTVSQAEANLADLRKAFSAQLGEIRRAASNLRTAMRGLVDDTALTDADRGQIGALLALLDQMQAGKIKVADFKSALDSLNRTTDHEGIKRLSLDLQNLVDSGLADTEKAIGEAEAKIRLLNGTATEADRDFILFAESAADAGRSGVKSFNESLSSSSSFGDKLDEIRKLIPGVGEELKRLGEIDALNKLYQDSLKVANSFEEATQAFDAYTSALNAINMRAFGGGSGSASAVDLIKGFEGFRSQPYWDKNAYRVGYGSDTVTLDDGSIQKVVQGIAISQTDAMRDLVRRVSEFQDIVRGQIGNDRFAAFTQQQQAALTSVAYNYGSLPQSIVEAIKSGTASVIADAIRSRFTDNGGLNAGRRNREADLFAGGGDTPKSAQLLAEAEFARAEKAKEYNASLDTRLSLQEQENANGGRLTEGAFVQKALAEELNRAKEAGVTLSDQQIERIKAQAAEEYRITQSRQEQKATQQEANLALQNAVTLLQKRNAIQQQLNDAVRSGNDEAVGGLEVKLNRVNSELQSAVTNARAMWEAIGGPEAQVKINQLDALEAKIRRSTTSMRLFGLSTQQWQQLAESFADGFIGIFDTFVNAIASGENAVKALGKAFLQFAADFLKQVATMIMRTVILKALGGLGLPVAKYGLAHTGGVVGSTSTGVGNARRSVAPAAFAYARRYHSGGIAGLRPNETPAILKEEEEILTRNDPRHRFNGGLTNGAGAAGGQLLAIRNILTLDPEFAQSMMTSSTGEKAIMTTLKKNAATIRQLIG